MQMNKYAGCNKTLHKPQADRRRILQVFDCVEDHMAVLKQCFDFESIKKLIAHPEFSMTYDSMCGVQGPYALGILEGHWGQF